MRAVPHHVTLDHEGLAVDHFPDIGGLAVLIHADRVAVQPAARLHFALVVGEGFVALFLTADEDDIVVRHDRRLVKHADARRGVRAVVDHIGETIPDSAVAHKELVQIQIGVRLISLFIDDRDGVRAPRIVVGAQDPELDLDRDVLRLDVFKRVDRADQVRTDILNVKDVHHIVAVDVGGVEALFAAEAAQTDDRLLDPDDVLERHLAVEVEVALQRQGIRLVDREPTERIGIAEFFKRLVREQRILQREMPAAAVLCVLVQEEVYVEQSAARAIDVRSIGHVDGLTDYVVRVRIVILIGLDPHAVDRHKARHGKRHLIRRVRRAVSADSVDRNAVLRAEVELDACGVCADIDDALLEFFPFRFLRDRDRAADAALLRDAADLAVAAVRGHRERQAQREYEDQRQHDQKTCSSRLFHGFSPLI